MAKTNENLLKLLDHFQEDMGWSGMTHEDLAQITEYTLKQLRTYLEIHEPQATTELATIEEAIDLVQTHMPDLL